MLKSPDYGRSFVRALASISRMIPAIPNSDTIQIAKMTPRTAREVLTRDSGRARERHCGRVQLACGGSRAGEVSGRCRATT